MTGRGLGYCAGFNMPGYANPMPGFGMGRGYGRGRGFGRGFRNMYYATGVPGRVRGNVYPGWQEQWEAAGPVPEFSEQDELKYLKQRSKYFGKMLDDINKRIDELERTQSGSGV